MRLKKGIGIKAFFDKYNHDMAKPLQKHKYIFVYLMCIEAVAGLIVWYFCVNINSILYAFQDELTGEWGISNFVRLFQDFGTSGAQTMLIALENTGIYFVMCSIIMPVSIYFVAFFLYKKILFNQFILVVMYLPGILSMIVLSTLFKNMLSPVGPISYFKVFYGDGQPFPDLLSSRWSAHAVMLAYIFIFTINGNLLLWLGTFKRIPDSVIEAGKLDGITPFKELFYVVTPMTWGTMSTLVILSFVGIFSAGGPQFYFTNGNYDTYTISYWIFLQVKDHASYNYPCAVGLFFTAVGLPVTLLVWKIADKIQETIEY